MNDSRSKGTIRCHRPWQEMIIDADGSVNPCCYWSAYGNYNQTLGNINQDSLEDIWNNENYATLRKHMAAGDLAAAGCENCFAIKQGLELNLLYDEDCEDINSDSAYTKNIQLLKHEVSTGASILEASPTLIAIAPSHHCHLRCLHCSQEPTRNLKLEKEDALEQVLSLQDVLVRLNAVGGEPFILPVWRNFLRDFDRENNQFLCFSTCTSATVVPEDIFDNLKKFKSVNINVSVDGTGSVYERVRVRGKWDRLMANILRLQDIVAGNNGSAIGISMSVMRSNIDDLPNFIRFVADLGVLFSIIPVTTPLSESLSSFSNIHRQTDGWRASFEESRRLVTEYWLPRYLKDRMISSNDEVHWRNAIDIVEAAIPWQRLRVPHFRVSVSIPSSINRLLFTRAQLKKQRENPSVSHLYAHIQTAGEECAIPPYHAPLKLADNGDFYFNVAVPSGRFEARIGDKWTITNDNWFSLIVPEGNKAGASYQGVWTSGKWQSVWTTARALNGLFQPLQKLGTHFKRTPVKENHIGPM